MKSCKNSKLFSSWTGLRPDSSQPSRNSSQQKGDPSEPDRAGGQGQWSGCWDQSSGERVSALVVRVSGLVVEGSGLVAGVSGLAARPSGLAGGVDGLVVGVS